MDKNFGERKVQVTREWIDMIKPLYSKSKEDFELLYCGCLGYALKAESYGDTLGFGNAELQELYEKTTIRRWTPETPALIDVKQEANE